MALSATPVNTAKGNTGSVTTNTSLALTVTAPTSGNWVTLAFTGNANSVFRATQTNVTWYAAAYTTNNSSGTKAEWLFIGRVFGSAGTTVTIARTDAAAFVGAAVYAEWTGTNIRLDQTSNATGSSASPASGATGATDTAVELMIGGFGIAGQFSGASTPFSAPVQSGGATGGTVSIVDQDNTTTNSANGDRAACMTVQLLSGVGTVNAGVTITSAQWTASVATFEQTTGGIAKMAGEGGGFVG